MGRGRARQAIYQIRVQGLLDPSWTEWFAGLEVRLLPGSETLLRGVVRDQAALHGLLVRIRDVGLVLLSLERAEVPEQPQTAEEVERCAGETGTR